MPVEKSAGAVIFTQHHLPKKLSKQKQRTKNGAGLRKEKGIIKYLLLHYPSDSRTPGKDYWDFPKGHIEKGEEELETVKREIKEETGLKDLKFIEGFKEWIKYFFKEEEKTVFKIVTFYLAETKVKKVKISSEHIGFKWFSYEKAIKKLIFENAKEILKKADEYLKTEHLIY